MNLKPILFALGILFAFAFNAQAQNCDPWIVKIYQEQHKRTPTAEECNIRNYNNGSWNSYTELQNYINAYVSRKQAAASNNAAQNCDPWIVQIYKQEFNKTPSAEECNIKNYNNGSWGSYAELTTHIKNYYNRKSSGSSSNSGNTAAVKTVKLQGDPWIFRAYREVYRREPIALELNPKNYNNGSWRSYPELKRYVTEFHKSLGNQKIDIRFIDTTNGNQLTALYKGNEQIAISLISKNGGQVVAAGGMNVISAGGANVVSAGSMNLISNGILSLISANINSVIAAGSANIIAPGIASIAMHQNMAGLNFGGGYMIQSEGAQVITTSGKGAFIIK